MQDFEFEQSHLCITEYVTDCTEDDEDNSILVDTLECDDIDIDDDYQYEKISFYKKFVLRVKNIYVTNPKFWNDLIERVVKKLFE